MPKSSQVPRLVRLGNVIVTAMVRAGFKVGLIHLLTVRGRKSGQPRTTPVAVLESDRQRWLVSPYGEVDWVKNLRKAGEAALTRGRRTERVSAFEVSPQEAALILKRALPGAPSFLRSSFDVAPDSPLEDFERTALSHPVFLLATK